jgi:hypothetical protein
MSDSHTDAEPISPGAVSQHSSRNNEPMSPHSSKITGNKKGKKKQEEPKDTAPKWEGEYTGAMVDGEPSCIFEISILYRVQCSSKNLGFTLSVVRLRGSLVWIVSRPWLHAQPSVLFTGIRHGKGSVKFPNGDTYHGDFRNGMRDGDYLA